MSKLRAADAKQRAARDTSPDFSEALARGIKIIGAFDAQRRQMTLSDVARAVDLPRATARRALYTLTELGYVEADGRLFRLTPKILQLASAYLFSNAVSAILQPVCERLSAEVDANCSVAVMDGEDVVMVARGAPMRPASIGLGIGFRLPAFCSALGRTLLSTFADKRLDEFLHRLRPKPVTVHTVIDKAALKRAILRIRQDGIALVEQEAELGMRSVAVPLRRFDGVAVAALNIAVPVERMSGAAMLTAFAPRLRREAAELKLQLI
jgi:IclR family transcriptional regulator, pca regulon regulatory protein